jgi:hypothetical protein
MSRTRTRHPRDFKGDAHDREDSSPLRGARERGGDRNPSFVLDGTGFFGEDVKRW